MLIKQYVYHGLNPVGGTSPTDNSSHEWTITGHIKQEMTF